MEVVHQHVPINKQYKSNLEPPNKVYTRPKAEVIHKFDDSMKTIVTENARFFKLCSGPGGIVHADKNEVTVQKTGRHTDFLYLSTIYRSNQG